jgi:hypothetical protein
MKKIFFLVLVVFLLGGRGITGKGTVEDFDEQIKAKQEEIQKIRTSDFGQPYYMLDSKEIEEIEALQNDIKILKEQRNRAQTVADIAQAEALVAKNKQKKNKIKENLKTLGESTTFDVTKIFSVGNEGSLTITDPESEKDTNILNRIIKLFAQVLGTFGILMLVIGGVLMITSEGDDNRLQKGKNIFLYTIVGLLVAFVSFIAVQFIISLLFSAA